MVEKLQQFQHLIDVSGMMSSSLELDAVLTNVIDNVISLSNAERAYLMLYDRNTEEMTVRAARNWDRENLTEDDVVFSKSIVQHTIDSASVVHQCGYSERRTLQRFAKCPQPGFALGDVPATQKSRQSAGRTLCR